MPRTTTARWSSTPQPSGHSRTTGRCARRLQRARLRASQAHFFAGRRLAADENHEGALVEFQMASELNPSDAQVEAALRETRQRLRTKIAISRGGKTDLQTLVDRTRDLPPPGLDLPADATLPDSLAFSSASSRVVFTAIARFSGINVVFDPTFRDVPITVDLRNTTLANALASVTASTRTFYRVTANRTITIIPDTPAKRREYEESVVRTFYLSNADSRKSSTSSASSSTFARFRRSRRPTRSRSRTRRSASRRRPGSSRRSTRRGRRW